MLRMMMGMMLKKHQFCPSNYTIGSLNFGDDLDINASSYNSSYNVFS